MINLKGGTENPAEGNCAWESAILNINERPEIEPKVNLDPGEAKIVNSMKCKSILKETGMNSSLTI